MWDLVVIVAQVACITFLAAGAVLSLWFRRLASDGKPHVIAKPEMTSVAEIRGRRAPAPALKRAA
jgi:hypothetical protein